MENTWILFQMKNEVVFKKSGMKWRGSFYKKEPEMASKGLNSCNPWESLQPLKFISPRNLS